jgi:uncharacterized protein YceH (UPF0502 family)
VAQLVERAAEQMRVQERAAATRSSSWDNLYRAQLRSAEEANTLLVEKHLALELAANARIADLEAEVARLKAALAKLNGRRALDNEGFASELGALRRELGRHERLWAKLRPGAREADAPVSAADADAARQQGDGLLERIRERLEALEASLAREREGRE